MHRFAEFVVPSRLGRSFRCLLASSWVTNLGDGITLAAGPLLVASQTHNPLTVAMAAFLQRLPWLLFGLYAGVVADRLNRRAIVITTGLVRVAILLLLTALILTHRVDIAVVLTALFLFGVNETFGDTTTTTLLPMLVAKPDLGIANSRAMTGLVVWNQLAGPPVGAALFAAGMALPFVSESVCVLAGVLLISRVRLPGHGARGRSARVRDEIREGWSWLWAHAAVRTLAITIFTFNVTFGAAWSVLVLYARERLGMGAVGFGLVASVWGVTAPFWFAFAGSALILARSGVRCCTSHTPTSTPEPPPPPKRPDDWPSVSSPGLPASFGRRLSVGLASRRSRSRRP